MKKIKYPILIVLSVLTLCFSCTSNREMDEDDIEEHNPENKKNNGPKGIATFKDTVWDFGKIQDGEIVYHDYTFKNTGKAPISIVNVQASCGCTTPEWTREVIPPGGEGIIKTTFNSGGKGGPEGPRVEKIVTVYFDNCQNDIQLLKFSSNIFSKGENQESDSH